MGSLHHLKRHKIVDNTDFDQTDVLCFTSNAQHSFTSKRAPFDQILSDNVVYQLENSNPENLMCIK